MTKYSDSDIAERPFNLRQHYEELGYSPVTILFSIFFILVGLLLVISYFWSSFRTNQDGAESGSPISHFFQGFGSGISHDEPNREKASVVLYFLDEGPMSLVAENRDVGIPSDLSQAVSIVIQELLVGSSSNHFSVIPEGTRLNQVYIDNARRCYLDFSTELIDHHPGGASEERLTVMALVKTVIDNFQQLQSVQLLVNGAEIDTIAGHIRVDHPLTGREFVQSD